MELFRITPAVAIEHQDAYHLWYRLNKELFPSLDRPLFTCFLCMPPDTSSWFKSGDSYNFMKLISDLMKYEGNENNCIKNKYENSNDDYLPIPDHIELDTCNIETNNLDKGGHGREY